MKESLIEKFKFPCFILMCAMIVALFIWVMSSIGSCVQQQQQERMIVKTYELIDKTTEIRTHRYLIIDNTIKTDHVLVWKSETGKILSCEAGRNSFYRYEKGKQYKFNIDPEQNELFQLKSACID